MANLFHLYVSIKLPPQIRSSRSGDATTGGCLKHKRKKTVWKKYPNRFLLFLIWRVDAYFLIRPCTRLRYNCTAGATLSLASPFRRGGGGVNIRRRGSAHCKSCIVVTQVRILFYPREYLCNSEPSSWDGDCSSRFPRLWGPIPLQTCHTYCKAPRRFPHGQDWLTLHPFP